MSALINHNFNLDKALECAGLLKETNAYQIISSNRSFGGLHLRIQHQSSSNKCDMIIGVYLPPSVLSDAPHNAPSLYWLSGLTCTDQNFLQKSGAMRKASQLGLVLICPDTSPRGKDVANDDGYDLGQGAGFYVDATEEPWEKHFNMYSYVTKELIEFCEKHLPITKLRSISGHSMGGHGALTLALKNPKKYQSVSAFSPICNPSQVPWGQKALSTYLGEDTDLWKAHDATELVKNASERLAFLIDQGSDDEFLAEQLSTEVFKQICQEYQHPATIRMQAGYDHSYFFIASFIDEHLEHHAKALKLI